MAACAFYFRGEISNLIGGAGSASKRTRVPSTLSHIDQRSSGASAGGRSILTRDSTGPFPEGVFVRHPTDVNLLTYEELQALSVACEGAIKLGSPQRGTIAECLLCPSYGDDIGLGHSTSIPVATFGPLSASDVREAIVTLMGCEPHSANWGGSALLEGRGGSWTVVNYQPGITPLSCAAVEPDGGRGATVCLTCATAQGISTCGLELLEVRDHFIHSSSIVEWLDDTAAACAFDSAGIALRLESWRVDQRSGERGTQVHLVIDARSFQSNSDESGACTLSQEPTEAATIELVYVRENGVFVIAPEAQQADVELQRFLSQSKNWDVDQSG